MLHPMNEERRKATAIEIKRLLDAGFIVAIKCPKWLSNPVLVQKKNGTWRLCIDYTNLNAACPKDEFVLPKIDRIIDSTAGSESLCFLDAYSGYNQIKMAVDDQEKTAFTTPFGCYMYPAMTFGLKKARGTYQRCMTECLKEQIGRNVHVYIDDVVVKSSRTDDLVADLTETFANLRRYNIKLNPEKCVFGVPSGQLLGFVVSRRGIEANPVKIATIQSLGPPKDVKDTQKLAGRVAASAPSITSARSSPSPSKGILSIRRWHTPSSEQLDAFHTTSRSTLSQWWLQHHSATSSAIAMQRVELPNGWSKSA